MADTDELVRVVGTGDGALAVGRSLPGRGAWLCADCPRCIDLAERNRAFPRALRAPVDPAAVGALRSKLGERARIGDCGNRGRED